MTWYNDVWEFDVRTQTWTGLAEETIGYIPISREGHSAAVVDDKMYIFGGRDQVGNDLGDLSCYSIEQKRWYTFKNMGPAPSPRSGHRMVMFGDQIYVVGGEPSSANPSTQQREELSMVYCLDTRRVRFPANPQVPHSQAAPKGGIRRLVS